MKSGWKRLRGTLRPKLLAPQMPKLEDAWPCWRVGSRYEVLRPVELVQRDSEEVFTLQPDTVVLVLAVRVVEDDGQEAPQLLNALG